LVTNIGENPGPLASGGPSCGAVVTAFAAP
jgi:hypothetical protein